MRRGAYLAGFLVLITGLAAAEDLRFQLALSGGIGHIFAYGSEKNYVQGENDFPVTPAHTPPYLGLSFSSFLTETLKLELDGRYAFRSRITLIDPSDDDSVEIDTAAQSFLSLNICYQCIRCNFRPYLLVGGGVNWIAVKEKTYTTYLGYEIDFSGPEKKTALMLQMGWGLDVPFGPSLGARVDVRFFYLFADPDNIPILFAGVGVFYLF
jgi:hypothetical protein